MEAGLNPESDQSMFLPGLPGSFLQSPSWMALGKRSANGGGISDAESNSASSTSSGNGDVGTAATNPVEIYIPLVIDARAPVAFVGVFFHETVKVYGPAFVFFIACSFARGQAQRFSRRVVRRAYQLQHPNNNHLSSVMGFRSPNARPKSDIGAPQVLNVSNNTHTTCNNWGSSMMKTDHSLLDDLPYTHSNQKKSFSPLNASPTVKRRKRHHPALTLLWESKCFFYQSDIQGGSCGYGIVCYDHSLVRVLDSSFLGPTMFMSAIELHDVSHASLCHANISVMGCGIVLLDRTLLTLTDSVIERCGLVALMATGNSSCEISNCGLEMSGSGTNMAFSGAAACKTAGSTICLRLPSLVACGPLLTHSVDTLVKETGENNQAHSRSLSCRKPALTGSSFTLSNASGTFSSQGRISHVPSSVRLSSPPLSPPLSAAGSRNSPLTFHSGKVTTEEESLEISPSMVMQILPYLDVSLIESSAYFFEGNRQSGVRRRFGGGVGDSAGCGCAGACGGGGGSRMETDEVGVLPSFQPSMATADSIPTSEKPITSQRERIPQASGIAVTSSGCFSNCATELHTLGCGCGCGCCCRKGGETLCSYLPWIRPSAQSVLLVDESSMTSTYCEYLSQTIAERYGKAEVVVIKKTSAPPPPIGIISSVEGRGGSKEEAIATATTGTPVAQARPPVPTPPAASLGATPPMSSGATPIANYLPSPVSRPSTPSTLPPLTIGIIEEALLSLFEEARDRLGWMWQEEREQWWKERMSTMALHLNATLPGDGGQSGHSVASGGAGLPMTGGYDGGNEGDDQSGFLSDKVQLSLPSHFRSGYSTPNTNNNNRSEDFVLGGQERGRTEMDGVFPSPTTNNSNGSPPFAQSSFPPTHEGSSSSPFSSSEGEIRFFSSLCMAIGIHPTLQWSGTCTHIVLRDAAVYSLKSCSLALRCHPATLIPPGDKARLSLTASTSRQEEKELSSSKLNATIRSSILSSKEGAGGLGSSVLSTAITTSSLPRLSAQEKRAPSCPATMATESTTDRDEPYDPAEDTTEERGKGGGRGRHANTKNNKITEKQRSGVQQSGGKEGMDIVGKEGVKDGVELDPLPSIPYVPDSPSRPPPHPSYFSSVPAQVPPPLVSSPSFPHSPAPPPSVSSQLVSSLTPYFQFRSVAIVADYANKLSMTSGVMPAIRKSPLEPSEAGISTPAGLISHGGPPRFGCSHSIQSSTVNISHATTSNSSSGPSNYLPSVQGVLQFPTGYRPSTHDTNSRNSSVNNQNNHSNSHSNSGSSGGEDDGAWVQSNSYPSFSSFTSSFSPGFAASLPRMERRRKQWLRPNEFGWCRLRSRMNEIYYEMCFFYNAGASLTRKNLESVLYPPSSDSVSEGSSHGSSFPSRRWLSSSNYRETFFLTPCLANKAGERNLPFATKASINTPSSTSAGGGGATTTTAPIEGTVGDRGSLLAAHPSSSSGILLKGFDKGSGMQKYKTHISSLLFPCALQEILKSKSMPMPLTGCSCCWGVVYLTEDHLDMMKAIQQMVEEEGETNNSKRRKKKSRKSKEKGRETDQDPMEEEEEDGEVEVEPVRKAVRNLTVSAGSQSPRVHCASPSRGRGGVSISVGSDFKPPMGSTLSSLEEVGVNAPGEGVGTVLSSGSFHTQTVVSSSSSPFASSCSRRHFPCASRVVGERAHTIVELQHQWLYSKDVPVLPRSLRNLQKNSEQTWLHIREEEEEERGRTSSLLASVASSLAPAPYLKPPPPPHQQQSSFSSFSSSVPLRRGTRENRKNDGREQEESLQKGSNAETCLSRSSGGVARTPSYPLSSLPLRNISGEEQYPEKKVRGRNEGIGEKNASVGKVEGEGVILASGETDHPLSAATTQTTPVGPSDTSLPTHQWMPKMRREEKSKGSSMEGTDPQLNSARVESVKHDRNGEVATVPILGGEGSHQELLSSLPTVRVSAPPSPLKMEMGDRVAMAENKKRELRHNTGRVEGIPTGSSPFHTSRMDTEEEGEKRSRREKGGGGGDAQQTDEGEEYVVQQEGGLGVIQEAGMGLCSSAEMYRRSLTASSRLGDRDGEDRSTFPPFSERSSGSLENDLPETEGEGNEDSVYSDLFNSSGSSVVSLPLPHRHATDGLHDVELSTLFQLYASAVRHSKGGRYRKGSADAGGRSASTAGGEPPRTRANEFLCTSEAPTMGFESSSSMIHYASDRCFCSWQSFVESALVSLPLMRRVVTIREPSPPPPSPPPPSSRIPSTSNTAAAEADSPSSRRVIRALAAELISSVSSSSPIPAVGKSITSWVERKEEKEGEKMVEEGKERREGSKEYPPNGEEHCGRRRMENPKNFEGIDTSIGTSTSMTGTTRSTCNAEFSKHLDSPPSPVMKDITATATVIMNATIETNTAATTLSLSHDDGMDPVCLEQLDGETLMRMNSSLMLPTSSMTPAQPVKIVQAEDENAKDDVNVKSGEEKDEEEGEEEEKWPEKLLRLKRTGKEGGNDGGCAHLATFKLSSIQIPREQDSTLPGSSTTGYEEEEQVGGGDGKDSRDIPAALIPTTEIISERDEKGSTVSNHSDDVTRNEKNNAGENEEEHNYSRRSTTLENHPTDAWRKKMMHMKGEKNWFEVEKQSKGEEIIHREQRKENDGAWENAEEIVEIKEEEIQHLPHTPPPTATSIIIEVPMNSPDVLLHKKKKDGETAVMRRMKSKERKGEEETLMRVVIQEEETGVLTNLAKNSFSNQKNNSFSSSGSARASTSFAPSPPPGVGGPPPIPPSVGVDSAEHHGVFIKSEEEGMIRRGEEERRGGVHEGSASAAEMGKGTRRTGEENPPSVEDEVEDEEDDDDALLSMVIGLQRSLEVVQQKMKNREERKRKRQTEHYKALSCVHDAVSPSFIAAAPLLTTVSATRPAVHTTACPDTFTISSFTSVTHEGDVEENAKQDVEWKKEEEEKKSIQIKDVKENSEEEAEKRQDNGNAEMPPVINANEKNKMPEEEEGMKKGRRRDERSVKDGGFPFSSEEEEEGEEKKRFTEVEEGESTKTNPTMPREEIRVQQSHEETNPKPREQDGEEIAIPICKDATNNIDNHSNKNTKHTFHGTLVPQEEETKIQKRVKEDLHAFLLTPLPLQLHEEEKESDSNENNKDNNNINSTASRGGSAIQSLNKGVDTFHCSSSLQVPVPLPNTLFLRSMSDDNTLCVQEKTATSTVVEGGEGEKEEEKERHEEVEEAMSKGRIMEETVVSITGKNNDEKREEEEKSMGERMVEEMGAGPLPAAAAAAPGPVVPVEMNTSLLFFSSPAEVSHLSTCRPSPFPVPPSSSSLPTSSKTELHFQSKEVEGGAEEERKDNTILDGGKSNHSSGSRDDSEGYKGEDSVSSYHHHPSPGPPLVLSSSQHPRALPVVIRVPHTALGMRAGRPSDIIFGEERDHHHYHEEEDEEEEKEGPLRVGGGSSSTPETTATAPMPAAAKAAVVVSSSSAAAVWGVPANRRSTGRSGPDCHSAKVHERADAALLDGSGCEARAGGAGRSSRRKSSIDARHPSTLMPAREEKPAFLTQEDLRDNHNSSNNEKGEKQEEEREKDTEKKKMIIANMEEERVEESSKHEISSFAISSPERLERSSSLTSASLSSRKSKKGEEDEEREKKGEELSRREKRTGSTSTMTASSSATSRSCTGHHKTSRPKGGRDGERSRKKNVKSIESKKAKTRVRGRDKEGQSATATSGVESAVSPSSFGDRFGTDVIVMAERASSPYRSPLATLVAVAAAAAAGVGLSECWPPPSTSQPSSSPAASSLTSASPHKLAYSSSSTSNATLEGTRNSSSSSSSIVVTEPEKKGRDGLPDGHRGKGKKEEREKTSHVQGRHPDPKLEMTSGPHPRGSHSQKKKNPNSKYLHHGEEVLSSSVQPFRYNPPTEVSEKGSNKRRSPSKGRRERETRRREELRLTYSPSPSSQQAKKKKEKRRKMKRPMEGQGAILSSSLSSSSISSSSSYISCSSVQSNARHAPRPPRHHHHHHYSNHRDPGIVKGMVDEEVARPSSRKTNDKEMMRMMKEVPSEENEEKKRKRMKKAAEKGLTEHEEEEEGQGKMRVASLPSSALPLRSWGIGIIRELLRLHSECAQPPPPQEGGGGGVGGIRPRSSSPFRKEDEVERRERGGGRERPSAAAVAAGPWGLAHRQKRKDTQKMEKKSRAKRSRKREEERWHALDRRGSKWEMGGEEEEEEEKPTGRALDTTSSDDKSTSFSSSSSRTSPGYFSSLEERRPRHRHAHEDKNKEGDGKNARRGGHTYDAEKEEVGWVGRGGGGGRRRGMHSLNLQNQENKEEIPTSTPSSSLPHSLLTEESKLRMMEMMRRMMIKEGRAAEDVDISFWTTFAELEIGEKKRTRRKGGGPGSHKTKNEVHVPHRAVGPTSSSASELSKAQTAYMVKLLEEGRLKKMMEGGEKWEDAEQEEAQPKKRKKGREGDRGNDYKVKEEKDMQEGKRQGTSLPSTPPRAMALFSRQHYLGEAKCVRDENEGRKRGQEEGQEWRWRGQDPLLLHSFPLNRQEMEEENVSLPLPIMNLDASGRRSDEHNPHRRSGGDGEESRGNRHANTYNESSTSSSRSSNKNSGGSMGGRSDKLSVCLLPTPSSFSSSSSVSHTLSAAPTTAVETPVNRSDVEFASSLHDSFRNPSEEGKTATTVEGNVEAILPAAQVAQPAPQSALPPLSQSPLSRMSGSDPLRSSPAAISLLVQEMHSLAALALAGLPSDLSDNHTGGRIQSKDTERPSESNPVEGGGGTRRHDARLIEQPTSSLSLGIAPIPTASIAESSPPSPPLRTVHSSSSYRPSSSSSFASLQVALSASRRGSTLPLTVMGETASSPSDARIHPLPSSPSSPPSIFSFPSSTSRLGVGHQHGPSGKGNTWAARFYSENPKAHPYFDPLTSSPTRVAARTQGSRYHVTAPSALDTTAPAIPSPIRSPCCHNRMSPSTPSSGGEHPHIHYAVSGGKRTHIHHTPDSYAHLGWKEGEGREEEEEKDSGGDAGNANITRARLHQELEIEKPRSTTDRDTILARKEEIEKNDTFRNRRQLYTSSPPISSAFFDVSSFKDDPAGGCLPHPHYPSSSSSFPTSSLDHRRAGYGVSTSPVKSDHPHHRYYETSRGAAEAWQKGLSLSPPTPDEEKYGRGEGTLLSLPIRSPYTPPSDLPHSPSPHHQHHPLHRRRAEERDQDVQRGGSAQEEKDDSSSSREMDQGEMEVEDLPFSIRSSSLAHSSLMQRLLRHPALNHGSSNTPASITTTALSMSTPTGTTTRRSSGAGKGVREERQTHIASPFVPARHSESPHFHLSPSVSPPSDVRRVIYRKDLDTFFDRLNYEEKQRIMKRERLVQVSLENNKAMVRPALFEKDEKHQKGQVELRRGRVSPYDRATEARGTSPPPSSSSASRRLSEEEISAYTASLYHSHKDPDLARRAATLSQAPELLKVAEKGKDRKREGTLGSNGSGQSTSGKENCTTQVVRVIPRPPPTQ